MNQPHIFGIRHLSPAGAWHLVRFLETHKPKLVLIEAPSDLEDQIDYITHPKTQTPIAILAYTKEAPVRTILYPFAEYSPEYQAICWCKEHHVECRFMDLPAEVFLALPQGGIRENEGEEGRMSVYELLDQQAGEDGHDTFWERTLEHADDTEAYHTGANTFGKNIRELSEGRENDWAEILVREAYMRRRIQEALAEGFIPEEIVVVTGAYHVEGLLDEETPAMTEEELSSLPKAESKHTLMPYSDYRLSTRSGYGAGNRAPAYYSLLWKALQKGDAAYVAESYLSQIAGFQRKSGTVVSSAEVIEAVRLANSLAKLRGSEHPALRDLRDAAVTCLGKGNFPSIALATADTEIGTGIGALPEGVSNTSIQEDFYRKLRELKLEKYRDIVVQDLALDLRENRKVSTAKAAFLDLNRSFFLHQLRVLGVSFGRQEAANQDNATWAENWLVRWTPEAEIELVEAALKGDTVMLAASFVMKERVENAVSISEIALVIEDAFECGMSKAVQYATAGLQALAVDAASPIELARTAYRLSSVLQYGSIRQLDASPLEPILQQIFYRFCLILPGECVCNDDASKEMVEAIDRINGAVLVHDFLDTQVWVDVLVEVADRDDLNTKLSGYAMAILLERSCMDNTRLKLEVSRRLSKGVPAELGAGWFEGLAMKNRYALIARLSLWESLDDYLYTLDEDEFKRALVFLRRAFADFSALEKDEIAENLGEIWGLNGQQVSEVLNSDLGEAEQQVIESLDDFDFDF